MVKECILWMLFSYFFAVYYFNAWQYKDGYCMNYYYYYCMGIILVNRIWNRTFNETSSMEKNTDNANFFVPLSLKSGLHRMCTVLVISVLDYVHWFAHHCVSMSMEIQVVSAVTSDRLWMREEFLYEYKKILVP